MPSLREEITRTFSRLTRLGDARAHEHRMRAVPDTRDGRQFGAYRIIRSLGAGGMGQVYLALDTRLGRHVALKFLASELISDEVSLMRLVQEARAASALNHPNILTIYDVGQIDQEHFIVSEFVEGVTLRTAMERGLINGDLAIDIASQVASALSAAHTAGVIHRDLKPTNVMLRPDGYIKVIDFGLAKRLRPSSAETMTGGRDLTKAGTTLGTADYMSPEQARGEEVDCRTDIWSLGVILYEMVAGSRPFEGPTHNHVLVAIQDYPPPQLPAGKSVPVGLHDVISRALAKKTKDRYGSVGEMLTALQATAGILSPSGSRVRIALPSRRVNYGRIAAVCAAVLLLAAAVFAWWKSRQPQWLHLEPVRQLTFNGRTQLDAISPDGKYLAYTVGQPDGQQALYLKQMDSPTDELKIPPRKIAYGGLTFSPDNQTLYVMEKDEALVGRLYAVPLLGQRSSNPIIVDIDGPISFSPDGNQFAYVQYVTANGPGAKQTVSHLIVSSRDGQNRRQLLSISDATIFRRPAWSPEGKRIAAFLFQRIPGHAGQALLDLVRLDGSESRRAVPDWQNLGQPRWTADSKSLIIGGIRTYSEPSRRYQLHQLSVIDGTDRLLTQDLAAYNEVSLSADGKEMTAVKTDSKAVVWISKPNDFRHGDTAPAEVEVNPSLTWADTAHLIVDSRRNGFPNLALLDTQTLSFGSLTNEEFVEQDATVVPGTEGKSFVFASNRAGYFHIWRFVADSNKFQQLTNGSTYDQQPSVSPDGKWVVYTSWTQNVPRLRKVSVEGGASISVGSFNAQNPQISPDGKWIACYLQNPATGKWITATIPFDTGDPPRPVPGASGQFRWWPDSTSIATVRTDSGGVSNIWRIPLNGGDPVVLTEFEDQSILAFGLSPNGDRLACLRAIVGADVTLFKTSN